MSNLTKGRLQIDGLASPEDIAQFDLLCEIQNLTSDLERSLKIGGFRIKTLKRTRFDRDLFLTSLTKIESILVKLNDDIATSEEYLPNAKFAISTNVDLVDSYYSFFDESEEDLNFFINLKDAIGTLQNVVDFCVNDY